MLLTYINYFMYFICKPRQFLFIHMAQARQKVGHPCYREKAKYQSKKKDKRKRL